MEICGRHHTVSEVVVKGGESHVQAIANRVIEWSRENRVQLNADKCKELRISEESLIPSS